MNDGVRSDVATNNEITLRIAPQRKGSKTPEEALQDLKEGNNKFKEEKRTCICFEPIEDPDCIIEQKPIAVVVGCSDSRVPPEIIFSQDLGDLFVIRSAGNTLDATAMGSLEYAVEKLGTPLVVVLGHQCCGAVKAAHDAWKCGVDYDGSMSAFVEPIIPAVIDASLVRPQQPDQIRAAAIDANVRRLVKRLRESGDAKMILPRIACGKLRIVGARYDFNGHVEFIDEGAVA